MATLTTSYQKLGTISTSTYSQLRIYGKYNSQSTANNTTSISIQLRLYGNGGSGSFSSGSCGISGIYNPTSGTTSYSTNLGSTSYSKGSEKTLATYTYSVNHRDDGTYSDTITYRVSSTGSVSGSGSVNFSLPTIARASQPSASPNPVDVGSATLISFNRASTSFTHDLSIVFGNISQTLGTGINADQIILNITSTFYNEFTSTERQKNATLTCVTKSGSTTIGTKTLTLGIRIPDSSKPTYTTPTKSETDASVISAIGSSMNKAVINLSKPRYQMILASQNGATLTSVQIRCGDLSNTITLSGTSYNLDYTFTNAMTSNVVQIIITDSRGLQTTYTDTYNNYETYTKPTITYQNIARSGLAGDVRIQLNGTLQATTIGGGTTNNISSSFRYKENASGSSWSSSTDLTSSISYNTGHNEWYLDVTETGIASYDKSWIFEITLADSSTSNTPITRTYTINRAVPTMSLGENDMQVNGEVVVDSIRSKNLYNKNSTYITGGINQNISNTILLKPNTDYYFKTGKGYTGVKLYDSSGTQTRSLGGSDTTTEIGFTTQSNEVKAILNFYSGQSNVNILNFDFTGIQLEEGNTATTYAPYQNLTGQIIATTKWGTLPSGFNGSLPYIKIGNVVYLSVMDYKTSSDITTQDTLLGSNFPKATTDIVFLSYRRDMSRSVRMKITTNGDLRLHYSEFPTSYNEIYGMVVYTTTD